jgi:hypothetical protein
MAHSGGKIMGTATIEKAVFTQPKKPLVKEYFDLDAHLNRHLSARLPFLSSCKMKVNQIFESKDGKTYRFRINWINADTGIIDLSKHVQIVTNEEGAILEYLER